MRFAALVTPMLGWLAAASCAGTTLRWDEVEVQDPAPTGPRYLREYKESHFRALGDAFRGGVTMPVLLQKLTTARVLYLGDHHTDRELHEKMLELLEAVARTGRPYWLGLECIGTQDAPVVDRFLAGQVDLDTLMQAVRSRWPDSWLERDGVDSAFYRSLLEHARRAGRPVFPLEPTPRLPLYERDQTMARTVLERSRANPDVLLIVVVGETHLLGHGQLVQRVALPHVAVCGSLSVGLRERAARARFRPEHRFAETTSGVLFFLPLDDQASG